MKIALFGNPNTGKSSIFNLLTGLRQQVGNFPGLTVERRSGDFQIEENKYTLTDFPGIYSIYPHTKDEEIVYKVITNSKNKDYPDLAIVVVDSANLERNLLLFTQLQDLKIPLILVLNMGDIAAKKGIEIDLDALKLTFPSVELLSMNARVGLGKDRLIRAIQNHKFETSSEMFLPGQFPLSIDDEAGQKEEANQRYLKINSLIQNIVKQKLDHQKYNTSKLDRLLTHPIFGYLIFIGVLFVIFQFIFSVANYPMDWIELFFMKLSEWTSAALPSGVLNKLLSQGLIPGIGGVSVFIPQIALLFFFIALLEESGYLSRVVFIMDKIMRPFGLNGKSIVPMMSGIACAIPGIMATRTIADWKERLITIIITPLMSCSARIPVYTLLIALVIPKTYLGGFISIQGLVLFGLYALGLLAALGLSIVLKLSIKQKKIGFLIMELPDLKSPRWGNVFQTVLEKVKIFVWDAGKVILAISIILWALASYGPQGSMEQKVKIAKSSSLFEESNKSDQENYIASAKLEGSYIGHLGKFIEPLIQPLGYDWKIGVSLLSSFAAREVFVGSLATIYAIHDDSASKQRLISRLKNAKNKDGQSVYTLASGCSLMVFYVFAMQCMATVAVVKRETNSWSWPIIQLVVMGAMAYLSAFFVFQILQ